MAPQRSSEGPSLLLRIRLTSRPERPKCLYAISQLMPASIRTALSVRDRSNASHSPAIPHRCRIQGGPGGVNEGNLAPEDCFLSHQVVTHAADDPDAFFDHFIDRNRRAPAISAALYAAGLVVASSRGLQTRASSAAPPSGRIRPSTRL